MNTGSLVKLEQSLAKKLKLEIFVSTEFGEVRVIVKPDGSPWFVLKDVCDALGIANISDAAARLDADERQITNINTLGLTEGIRGNPNVGIINESGLYSLIIRSDKPEAKKFRRWVTHEVLPSIRKHGNYSIEDVEWMALRKLTIYNYKLLACEIDKWSTEDGLDLNARKRRHAEEFDMLNEITFNMRARDWKKANPDLKGNQRDNAPMGNLDVIAGLQFSNAMLIMNRRHIDERRKMLTQVAENAKSIHLHGSPPMFDSPVIDITAKHVKEISDMTMDEINQMYIDSKMHTDDFGLTFNLLRNQLVNSFGLSSIQISLGYKTQQHIWDAIIRLRTSDVLVDIDSSFHLDSGGLSTDGLDVTKYFSDIRELRKSQTDGKRSYIILAHKDLLDYDTPVVSVDGKELMVFKEFIDKISHEGLI
jgi:prophage antirepressor-like protein